MIRTVTYIINDKSYSCVIEGEAVYGSNIRMLDGDINLLENLTWEKDGYFITKFLPDDDFELLKNKIKHELLEIVKDVTGAILSNPGLYHQHVDDVLHNKVMKKTYDAQSNEFIDRINVDIKQIETRISEIICQKVTSVEPYNKHNRTHFFLRVVRPNVVDNNPYHRDVWLDHLRNAVNIYVPLWGSNELSSLPLMPGSHHWKESEIERTIAGAKVNGKTYTVPAITNTKYGLNSIRPNPNHNEVMIFSPYAIHGGGENLNKNLTRISLEMRFWKQ